MFNIIMRAREIIPLVPDYYYYTLIVVYNYKRQHKPAIIV